MTIFSVTRWCDTGDYSRIDGVYEVPIPGGSLHLVNRIANSTKAAFEDWLEGQARKRVFQIRGQLEPQEFKESMRAVAEASGAGSFSWLGDAWLAAMNQVPGVVKMVCLLANHPKAKERNGKAIDESYILALAQADKKTLHVLSEAIKEIGESDPNFTHPPTRGAED